MVAVAVADGRFSSFDQAVAEAIDSLKADTDEFAWAEPLVEEGLAELQRGETVSADEVFARIEAGLRAKIREMARLRFAPAAARDLQGIVADIADVAGERVALAFLGRLRRSLEGLAEFPQMGRSRPCDPGRFDPTSPSIGQARTE